MPNRLKSDIGYAFRRARKAPAFSAVVVVTLALGIGMTTAMFSVVDGLLLTRLPFPESERLVMLWQGRRGQDVDEDWFSVAQFVDIREGTDVFEEVTLAVGFGATLTNRGPPQQVGYVRTTSTYLRLLGATPAVGRILDSSDDEGNAPQVAVLSWGLWQRAFGGDPDVVGQAVTLNGTDTEIVGVLSRDVLLDNEILPTLGAVDPLGVVLSLPLSEALLAQRNREDYNIVGRLREGVSLAQAQAQLDAVAARIQELHETDPASGFFIRAMSLQDEVVGEVRPALMVLLASVAILLLIACGNVANLLLSRAAERERELGVRAAVGAGRGRLVRQMITESAVLASLGGVLGLGVAVAGVAILRRVGSVSLPRVDAITLDGGVLAFSVFVTAFTVLLFGLLPALRASRLNLSDVLKQGHRGGVGGALWARFNLSSLLVILEVALSLILLIGGGLLGRSLLEIQEVDPGFGTEGRLSFGVQLSGPEFPPERRLEFVRDLSVELAEIPTVTHVGGVSLIPFGGNLAWTPVIVPGYDPPDGTNGEFIASIRIVTPEYFETMGIPVLDGETFRAEYAPDEPRAILIDERVAEVYFQGRDPVGSRISTLGNDSSRVAGVVGAIKHTGLDDPSRFTLYLAYSQVPTTRMAMVLETSGDPMALVGPATRAVHGLDPDVAVVDMASMEGRISSSLAERRFLMLLLQTFSVVALVLAAVGIFGLVSYRVSRGTRDLGMRMALGAEASTILKMVLGHGMTLALVGLAVGLAGAVALTGLLRGMLFGVGSTDPGTYAAMAGGLVLIVFVACLLPARRATRIDPMEALRSE
jgi:predicted permease